MTLRRLSALILALFLASILLPAQGLDTPASKDDWEEINFEFNSSVMVDGFPSLLRMAELLQRNPTFKVRVEGHTDGIGNDAYNQRLGMQRATMVRDFLVKYGAQAGQIETISRGKAQPKARNEKPVYGPTDEARYMNRRVVLTVMDAQGRTVGAGGAGDAIRALNPGNAGGLNDCCSEVLKRLDKLDEIAKALRDLADANAALRKEVADLKTSQNALQAAQDALRNGQNAAQQGTSASQQAINDRLNKLPGSDEIATAAANEIDKRRAASRFQLLGVNVGPDGNGQITFSGRGRYFQTMGERFAVQLQGEYLYYKTQHEGQFDVGLVDRLHRRVQAGLFASFKEVTLTGNQSGATLGQAAFTLDYLFKRGRVGMFGTKSFMDGGVINRANALNPQGGILANIIEERYLRIVDQAGVSGTIGLFGKTYLVGNAGYLKSYAAGDRFGGTLRFVFPLNSKIAFTAEGGVNETLLARDNNGRAAFGVQFGNFMAPKDYLDSGKPVPAEVPRVRYEVLTRQLRVGNAPPVADAGPEQNNIPPGAVQLDGSASYDPDGDPITFQWSQEGGTTVALNGANTAKPSFTAIAGQIYIFKLLVKDDHGGQGQARVRLTSRTADKPSVLFFTADPREIVAGGSSQLSWRVTGADTVTINNGVGTVPLSGSAPVSPAVTTTYTLTAHNSAGDETATATVVVTNPAAKLLYCYAQPATIASGESATLNWSAPNATSVTITPNVGAVAKTGTFSVTPTQTTAYTLTAVGPNGASQDQCGIVVNVNAGGGLPIIARFSATPTTINAGDKSTLQWQVQNADKVNITTLGDVALNGTQDVTPPQTTTYVLTATNKTGSATSQVTVTVNATALKINSFTADPPVSPTPGTKVTLTCDTTGATGVTVNGIFFLPPKAVATVFPTVDTTYTCVAQGPNGTSATQTVNVKVTQPTTTTPNNPTIVIAGGNFQETIYRDIIIDASQSFSPIGNNPLTYVWVSRNNSAAILNPTSPNPRVQLGVVGGDYLFDVTVTDSKGNQTLVTVTIRFTNVAFI